VGSLLAREQGGGVVLERRGCGGEVARRGAAAWWPGEARRRPSALGQPASWRNRGRIWGYGLDGGKNRKAVSGEDDDANSTVQHGDDGDGVVRGHRNDRDGGTRHGEEQTRCRGDSERWGRRGGEAASA
jgi:hypothetical protein